MRPAGVLLLALLAGCGGSGEWREVAEAGSTTVAVDLSGAHPLGPGVYRLWERASLRGRIPWSAEHRYALVDYDCAGRRLRLVQFAREPAAGELARVAPTGAWTSVRPGDLGDRKLSEGCPLLRQAGGG